MAKAEGGIMSQEILKKADKLNRALPGSSLPETWDSKSVLTGFQEAKSTMTKKTPNKVRLPIDCQSTDRAWQQALKDHDMLPSELASILNWLQAHRRDKQRKRQDPRNPNLKSKA